MNFTSIKCGHLNIKLWEKDKHLHVVLTVSSILKNMQNKACQSRASILTSGSGFFVQSRVKEKTTLSGCGSVTTVEKYRGPTILQLNIEALTTSKISIIEYVANNKALAVLIQRTHCTNINRMVLPHFSLAGSVLSRKHGLPPLSTNS